jgi:hypothetical protein
MFVGEEDGHAREPENLARLLDDRGEDTIQRNRSGQQRADFMDRGEQDFRCDGSPRLGMRRVAIEIQERKPYSIAVDPKAAPCAIRSLSNRQQRAWPVDTMAFYQAITVGHSEHRAMVILRMPPRGKG